MFSLLVHSASLSYCLLDVACSTGIMLYMQTGTGHLPRRASATLDLNNGHSHTVCPCPGQEKTASALLRSVLNAAKGVPIPLYMLAAPAAYSTVSDMMGVGELSEQEQADQAAQQNAKAGPPSRQYGSQLEADLAAHNDMNRALAADRAMRQELDSAQTRLENEGQDTLTNKILGKPEAGGEFATGRILANLGLNLVGAEDMYSAYRNFQQGNVLSGLGNVATGLVGLIPGVGMAGRAVMTGAKLGLKGMAAARAVNAAGKASKAWKATGAVGNIARQAAKPMSRASAAWNELRPGARTIQANNSMSISNPVQYGMEHELKARRILPNQFSFLTDTASPGGAFNHVAVPQGSGAFTRGMAGTYNWLGSRPWARAQRAAPMLGTFNRVITSKPAELAGYAQTVVPMAIPHMSEGVLSAASPFMMKSDVDYGRAKQDMDRAVNKWTRHQGEGGFNVFGDDQYGRPQPQQGFGQQPQQQVTGNYNGAGAQQPGMRSDNFDRNHRLVDQDGQQKPASVNQPGSTDGQEPFKFLGNAQSMHPYTGLAVPQYKPAPGHVAHKIVQSDPTSIFAQQTFAPYIFKYLPQVLPGLLNDTASEIARSAKPTMNLKNPAYVQAMLAAATFADRRFQGYQGQRPNLYEQYR